jgi:phage gpG-like protein
MNIDYKIDQKDLRLLKKKIKSLKDYSGQTLSSEIGKTGFAIERRSKRKVPVDTGGLKQSIKTYHSGKKAFVEAGKNYAPYIEFGTGSKVDLTDMKGLGIPESYAKQFKGKGIRDINLPARPFLFPSARTEFLNLLKRITDKLKKLT